MPERLSDLKILIRGAGEMASGTAWRLHRSGFFKLLMTEVAQPLAVRRLVSFCEALHNGKWTVEGVVAARIGDLDEAFTLWAERTVPVLVDPQNQCRHVLGPDVIVDGILAKHNVGTHIDDARLVIGMGPGFCAGRDVHYVVETNRGHDLGRVIAEGEASADTGVPGVIEGRTVERVLRSPKDGVLESDLEIGASVEMDQVVGYVDGQAVRARVKGILRGLIRPGTPVTKGLKIGDVDPRGNPTYCPTISEKARAIGGAVLEAIMREFNTPS